VKNRLVRVLGIFLQRQRMRRTVKNVIYRVSGLAR
jgi:hypothetical protein